MRNYLQPAVSAGIVEALYKESARHPQQKYQLTFKGTALLAGMEADQDDRGGTP